MQDKNESYFLNKSIAITGASSGLGKELACRLSKYKVNLFLIARSSERLKTIAKEIKTSDNKITVIQADLSKKEDCKKFILKIQQKSKKLDLFFLNAGMSMWQQLKDVKDESCLQQLIDTNYFGVAHPLYYGLDYLKKSSTTIAVTLSIQAYMGVPYHSGYVAAKHATNGFIDTLLLEEDLDIIKIIPGWIRGTELREKSLSLQMKNTNTKATSSKNKKNNWLSISVEEASEQIISSVIKNKKNIYLPKVIKYIRKFNYLFPQTMAKQIKKAINKE